MKRKNVALKVTGVFMILSAWTAVVFAVLVFISRLGAVGSSMLKSVISAAMVLVWAFLNLYLGFAALKSQRKKQLKKIFIIGIISIVIFIFQCLLMAANGVYVVHLLVLSVCGFVIPCLNLFICRSRM